MLVLFIEVVSVNIIGSFTTRKQTIAQNAADAIVGEWVDEDKTRTIKITKTGTVYEGILTAAPKAELIGKKILNSLVYADNKYTGKVYAPKRDAFYDCVVKLKDNNTLLLGGSLGLISKETVWTRKK